ncbi:MAG: hypothetical protein ACRED1_14610 [Limisphaerales bacterium]
MAWPDTAKTPAARAKKMIGRMVCRLADQDDVPMMAMAMRMMAPMAPMMVMAMRFMVNVPTRNRGGMPRGVRRLREIKARKRQENDDYQSFHRIASDNHAFYKIFA